MLVDFSLKLPDAGAAALSGKSGCGKTTVLRLLMGLIAPDAGLVATGGARFSAVFQEDRLLERLSAGANLRFVAPRAGEAELARHLAALGLSGERGPVSELSGGMRRRVALARAVISESDFIVLDEPFKGLDAATRARAAEYLLAEKGARPLLIVTHDDEEARLVGARDIIRM